jgi:hypothetical protein
MTLLTIIEPWFTLIVILTPLIAAERWIHQHLYGVGYLLTKDEEAATTIYYLIFFPGVFIHEFVQYMLAGILNIKIKEIHPRPQRQENGTLRYDFVTIDKTTRVKAMIMGGVPFLIGAGLVWYISTELLNLTEIPVALASGRLTEVGSAISTAVNTPDFWLWFFLLFSLSNGIIPTKEDRAGWGLIAGALGIFSVLLIIIGSGEVLVETLVGPVSDALVQVNTALALILMIDLFAILVLGITEDTLERIRGEKMDYSGDKKKAPGPAERVREPGSNLPLPKGELMPSVYNLELPLPELPTAMPRPAAPPSRPAAPATSPQSAPSFNRPSTASSFSRPGSGEERQGPRPAPAAGERPASRQRETPFTRPATSQAGERSTSFTRPTPAPSQSGDQPSRRPTLSQPGERPASASPFSRPSSASTGRSPGSRPDEDERRSRVDDFRRRREQVEQGESQKPAGGSSDPLARPATELSPDERKARLEELRRKREQSMGERTPSPSASRPPTPTSSPGGYRSRMEELRRQRDEQHEKSEDSGESDLSSRLAPASSMSPEQRRARIEELRRKRAEREQSGEDIEYVDPED